MYRLEVYKLWLGLLEKTFLLILAVVVVPSVVGRIELSTLTVGVWAAIGIIIFVAYASLSLKARRIADGLDTERKKP